jgi:hypothetical protein
MSTDQPIACSLSATEFSARLEALVAEEARCCPFLTMNVSEDPDGIRLHVVAPAGAEEALSEITEAFGDRTKTTGDATSAL